MRLVGCPGQFLDRGAHAEIVDPLSVAVEHDGEDHQRQVVKFPGGQAVAVITRAAFITGLNYILLVAAIIALVSGAVALAAIRSKDFARQQGPGSP